MAKLAAYTQAVRGLLTAGGAESVLAETGADTGSTEVYGITFFRDSAGECRVCVCLYHDNFTEVVIQWLNKLYVQLEERREISWFIHQ